MGSPHFNPMMQMPMDGDNPSLPEDITRNILKRLPVKSLIRFQCVCKHWKNLIKTPSFIADHLHHSTHRNPLLLFQGYGLFHPSGWCFLDNEMQVVAQSAPLVGSLSGVRIVGSSNGVLCFQLNDSSIFLCNPAIREVRYALEAVNIPERRDFRTGFGFSSIVNDYKIVRIHVSMVKRFIRSEQCFLGFNRVNQVHLYSLSTGSWKNKEFGHLDGVSIMSNGLNANGAIFWFGFMLSVGKEEDGNVGHLVVSFDIATEVFTLIPLPSSVPKSYRNSLAVHENKLAMLSHTTIGRFEFSLVDLWVMEEGIGASREKWNWTKKYSISPYPYLLHPGTIWRNGIVCNVLCLGATKCEVNKGEGKVALFSTATNEFKMFDIPKYGDGVGSFFNYVESLVSVRTNHIEEF